jgi:hypothetical protein
LEEVTLADIYAVLKRWRFLIVGLTVVGVALALLVSLLLPKVYVSRVVLSLSAPQQQAVGQEVSDQLLANLPSVTGLAKGFDDLLATKRVAEVLNVPAPSGEPDARFDEKKNLLTLRADGGSAEEASQNATQLLTVTKRFITTRVVRGMLANAESMISRATLDRETALQSLQGLRAAAGAVPRTGAPSAATSAGLEGQGVRPPVARASDPALVDLSLEESKLRAQVAKTEARIVGLQALIKNPGRLESLVGQAVQVQELVPVTQPLQPDSPRPLLYAALAGVLSLMLGLLIPFVVEAVRSPGLPTQARGLVVERQV